MTAKEYLSQVYRIDLRINTKLEQVRSLHSLATKASATLSDSPLSGTRNVHSMEDIIVKMVDLKDEINADIGRLVELKREIVSTIEQVSAVDHRTLLELRYVCGKTWEEIAADMYYSVRNVHILHGAALCEVGRVLRKQQGDD